MPSPRPQWSRAPGLPGLSTGVPAPEPRGPSWVGPRRDQLSSASPGLRAWAALIFSIALANSPASRVASGTDPDARAPPEASPPIPRRTPMTRNHPARTHRLGRQWSRGVHRCSGRLNWRSSWAGIVCARWRVRERVGQSAIPWTCTTRVRAWGISRCSKRKSPCQVPAVQFSIGDGDRLGGACDRGAQVGGHVVGPFICVGVARVAGGCQSLEPALQVERRRRGRVLLDQKARRRVPAVDRAEAQPDSGALDDLAHLCSDLDQARTSRGDP